MERKLAITNSKTHKPRLVLTSHAHAAVHGDHPLGRINSWIAVHITRYVGSMWCAYVFTAIALISLPAAIATHDPIIIVSWVAQTFLQLVLLPIIIVGQNVLAEASDARAESDHETLISIHTLTSEVHTLSEQQSKVLELLAARAKR